jgi:hypothetical protein
MPNLACKSLNLRRVNLYMYLYVISRGRVESYSNVGIWPFPRARQLQFFSLRAFRQSKQQWTACFSKGLLTVWCYVARRNSTTVATEIDRARTRTHTRTDSALLLTNIIAHRLQFDRQTERQASRHGNKWRRFTCTNAITCSVWLAAVVSVLWQRALSAGPTVCLHR